MMENSEETIIYKDFLYEYEQAFSYINLRFLSIVCNVLFYNEEIMSSKQFSPESIQHVVIHIKSMHFQIIDSGKLPIIFFLEFFHFQY